MSELYLYCQVRIYKQRSIIWYTEYFKLGKNKYNIFMKLNYIMIYYNNNMDHNNCTKLTFRIRNVYDFAFLHEKTEVTEIINKKNKKNYKGLYDVFKSCNEKSIIYKEMIRVCDNIINTNRVLDKKDIDCHDRYEFANDGKKSLIKLLNSEVTKYIS